MMNIEKFFDLSAGKWFAHRTIHELTSQKSIESKSEIIIERLDSNHPDAIRVYEAHQTNPPGDSVVLKITWNDTTRLNQKNVGSIIMIAISNPNRASTGKVLFSDRSEIGEYKLGNDESLTLSLTTDKSFSEERLWFASDNLRMRVSKVADPSGITTTAFTSEIRMGGMPGNKSQVAQSTSS